MIRAIVRLGGGYAEVVQALQEARQGGYLDAKVVVNAMARPDRAYHRGEDAAEDNPDEPSDSRRQSGSRAVLRTAWSRDDDEDDDKPSYEPEEVPEEPAENSESGSSFMGRMTDWFAK